MGKRFKVFFWNTRLGKVATESRPLNEKERDWCLRFLSGLQIRREHAEEDRNMSKQQVINQCFIAGTIRYHKIDGKRGFIALDVGADRWIPCSLFDDDELLKRLMSYQIEDFIQVKGYARAWSTKGENGKWLNSMDIRIAEIRSEDPKRARQQEKTQSRRPDRPAAMRGDYTPDDDIPF